MKRLIFPLIGLAQIILFICCTTDGRKITDETNSRIKLVESRMIQGEWFSIVKVDSVEYLSVYRAGIVQLGKRVPTVVIPSKSIKEPPKLKVCLSDQFIPNSALIDSSVVVDTIKFNNTNSK